METSYSRPQMRPPGRPIGDLRTPVAWRQREYNLNNQHHFQEQQHQQVQHQRRRGVTSPASLPVSSTDTTAEEEEEEEEEERGADGDESSELDTSVSGQRRRLQQQQRHRQRYSRIHQSHCAALKSQTIRSTRSVPAQERASWPDGGTAASICPVHGGYTMHPGQNNHHHHHHHHHQRHPHHGHAFPVNAYMTSDSYVGGPMRRAGSMFDLRPTGAQLAPHYYPTPSPPMYGSLHRPMPIGYGPASPPPPPALYRTLEKNKKASHYGSLRSLHSLHPLSGGPSPINPLVLQPQPPPPPPAYNLPPMPPPHLLPPGMRPRPLVIPAGVEPLPVRDPIKSKMTNGLSGSTSKLGVKALEVSGRCGDFNEDDVAKRRCHCCRGPALPLIWFIVTIVTVGVVLGVILGSIYG